MTAKPPEHLFLDRMQTPLGEALLVTDEAGRLRAFDWMDHEPRLGRLLRLHYGSLAPQPGATPAAQRDAIDRYFAGDLSALRTIEWRTRGTAFQQAVWRGLCDIPAGQTLSYGALAERLGRPTAVRAVGLANGANPVGLVVPCHRVIGATGALTGYGGGLERKRWLLNHEGAHFSGAERRAIHPDQAVTELLL
jgi:methylated-DNA-[protein]-cysteine S-methyltransferase